MLQIKFSHFDTGNWPVYSLSYSAKGISFEGYICWSNPINCRIYSSIDGVKFTMVVNNVDYYVSNLTLSIKDRWTEGGIWKQCWGKDYPLSIHTRDSWGGYSYSSGPSESANKKINVMIDLLVSNLDSGLFLPQQMMAYLASINYNKQMLLGEAQELQKKVDAIQATRLALANEEAAFLADNLNENHETWFSSEFDQEINL